MGKRSNFARAPRDFYPTPEKAVLPLLPFLPEGSSFIEPCAGDGRLSLHLKKHGLRLIHQSDIAPRGLIADGLSPIGIRRLDALEIDLKFCAGADFIITNPPVVSVFVASPYSPFLKPVAHLASFRCKLGSYHAGHRLNAALRRPGFYWSSEMVF